MQHKQGKRRTPGIMLGIAGVLAATATSAVYGAIPASTYAYWDFNNASDTVGATDSVGGNYGYHIGSALTANGGGVSGQAGDYALDLGTTQASQNFYVPFTDPTGFNNRLANDKITIAFWQKWHTPRVNAAAFRFNSPSSANGTRGISSETPWGDGTIPFDTGGTGAEQRIVRNINGHPDFPGYNEQEWHHFAFVKNGSQKYIYIDGKLFHSGVNTQPLAQDIQDLVIGAENSGGTSSAQSVFDNFVIFTDSLPQAAVQVLATVGGTLDQVNALIGDDDSDGMPNYFEDQHGLNKSSAADASQDPDSDGLTNLQEFQKGTNPKSDDTDSDGLKDGVETGTGTYVSASDTGTSPTNPDTDGDGLKDGVETNTGTFVSASDTGTSPLNKDTDGDAFKDKMEIDLGSSPVDASAVPVLINGSGTINWVSFHAADDQPSAAAVTAGFTEASDVAYTKLLRANGFTVVRSLTSADPDTAALNQADLVIISRSVNSGGYQNAPSTLEWNHDVTKPTMILSGYILRNSRLGYTTGATIPDTSSDTYLTVSNPSHPIFTGIQLDGNNRMVNPYSSIQSFTNRTQLGISVNTDAVAGNGVVLAGSAAIGGANGGMIIGEWEAGATMGNASADTLGGKRMVFLSGSRESGITGDGAGIYDLEADGTRLFLNAVAYMLGLEIGGGEPPEFTGATYTGGNVTITWDGGGTLQSSDSLNGPWEPVAGASSPFVTPANGAGKFYRVAK